MSPARVLEHFDRISDAPAAVPRLRRFILDLAVRGKLVEQDPNDEPATELHKRIQAEKARSLKAGHSGKTDSRPDIEPFALPRLWAWTRLGGVIHLVSGQHLQPSEYSNQEGSGPPYITGPADFGQGGLVITRYAVVRKAVATKGQILLTVKGAGVGKTAICDLPEVAISRQLMAMTAIEWSQRFLLLTTHRLAEALKESARSLIPGISREDVDEFVFPLPPLAEQHRIVAKADELMALCDRLEAAQTERETRRDRLVTASLNRLNELAADAADAQSFRDHARFHLTHLPRLTTRTEHIQQLRQTILNLAVSGKLAPQDPNDEAAPARRLRAVAEERSRAGHPAPLGHSPVPEVQHAPFAAPRNWTWALPDQLSARVGNALTIGPFGSDLVTSDYTTSGTPLVFVRDIRCEFAVPPRHFISERKATALRSHTVTPGDLLITKMGDPPGDTAIYPSDRPPAVITADCIKWTLHQELVLARYLYFALRAPCVAQQIVEITKGAVHQKISLRRFRGIALPLPPLAEQHRVVAKVDELMALCDRLEAQLTTTQTETRRLLEAVVHQALTPVA